MVFAFRSALPAFLLVALALALAGCEGPSTDSPPDPGTVAGWDHYGNDTGGARHSLADQITPENVGELEVAWTFNTGDLITEEDLLAGGGAHGQVNAATTFQNTPILVDDALYICTPFNRVIAIDAETGEERWSHDPEVDLTGLYLINCRGVSAWTDARARPDEVCATRIFTGTIDARLIALDAKTGEPCEDFGDGGTVDLTEGIGDVGPGEYGVTSPPVVLGDEVGATFDVARRLHVGDPDALGQARDVRA